MTAPGGNHFVAAGAMAVLEAKLVFQEWVMGKRGLGVCIQTRPGATSSQSAPVPLCAPSLAAWASMLYGANEICQAKLNYPWFYIHKQVSSSESHCWSQGILIPGPNKEVPLFQAWVASRSRLKTTTGNMFVGAGILQSFCWACLFFQKCSALTSLPFDT